VDAVTLAASVAASKKAQAETLGTKLRRLAAHARTTDPYSLPALTPARAWAPTTAYLQGAVVSNGGNVYVCVIGGTSAASGGPTTTLAAIQADGTVSWGYMGPTAAQTVDPRAPAYSSSASVPAGLNNIYTPGTALGFFKVYGASGANASGSLVLNRFLQAAGGAQANGDARVSFWTDAPKFCLDVSGSTGGSNLVRLRIDGQFYSQANLDVSAAVSFHTFDFTTVGGRRPRLIELECSRNAAFRGFRTTGLDQIWPVSDVDKVRAVWISDSLFAGSAYGPFTQSTAQIAGTKLGWRDNWNLSIGGTGWLNPGTSSFYTYGQRVPQALALTPDVWVFVGSINDIAYPAAQVTAAALAAFQAIRAGGSTAPIIVAGLWSADLAGTRTQAQLIATEAAVQAAVMQFADPLKKTWFIPIATDPLLPWITTTNNNAARTGSVNVTQIVSSDNTHPTEYGTLYYAGRLDAAVRAMVLPQIA
jgi:hypothetical protein